MATEKEFNAQIAFDTLCEMLDERQWKYSKNEEKLEIHTGAIGDDLPIEITMKIDVEKQIVSLLSPLNFIVPEKERVAVAVAVNSANYDLVDGCFDFSVFSGKILFRMTSSIINSVIGKDLFEYMLYVSCKTIDDYNNKFFMLTKKCISLEEFIDSTKE